MQAEHSGEGVDPFGHLPGSLWPLVKLLKNEEPQDAGVADYRPSFAAEMRELDGDECVVHIAGNVVVVGSGIRGVRHDEITVNCRESQGSDDNDGGCGRGAECMMVEEQEVPGAEADRRRRTPDVVDVR